MALITEIRKNVTDATPLMAVVGATDYAAERVREAAASAGDLQQAPVLVVHRAMELATRVEESYRRLAARGKAVVARARDAAPTQDLLEQGKTTISRARAVVTSARKALDDSTAAAKGVFIVGRREARDVAGAVEAEVAESVAATEKVVAERTQGTRAAVKDAATTVRKRAASTGTVTRTAATSARQTATKAVAAVEAVAGHIGEEPVVPQPEGTASAE